MRLAPARFCAFPVDEVFLAANPQPSQAQVEPSQGSLTQENPERFFAYGSVVSLIEGGSVRKRAVTANSTGLFLLFFVVPKRVHLAVACVF